MFAFSWTYDSLENLQGTTMRIKIWLRDNIIEVSGLLIREREFPVVKLEEALAYIRECIEKELYRQRRPPDDIMER